MRTKAFFSAINPLGALLLTVVLAVVMVEDQLLAIKGIEVSRPALDLTRVAVVEITVSSSSKLTSVLASLTFSKLAPLSIAAIMPIAPELSPIILLPVVKSVASSTVNTTSYVLEVIAGLLSYLFLLA